MSAATAPAGIAPATVTRLQADGAGRFRLSGAATMGTVAALRAEGLQAFAASSGDITVDLAGLTRVDSAGLALLIDWLAWARTTSRALRFAALPESLRALARLSDVEPFLA
jgi:phospholipid transport system transporter-binding protein